MSFLDNILAAKHEEVGRLRPRGAELRSQAAGQIPARPFSAALRAGNNVALIAEFKRRSPSAGWIREDGSVADMTTAYSEAGARAISVLTDRKFFGGSLEDLITARAKTSVPVLRKDFIIDEIQIVESRAAGADALLLIVRALADTQLRDLVSCARASQIEPLVECHDIDEVERALDAGADLLGINNRDLTTFTVDRDLAAQVARVVPASVTLVAESGVRNAADVAAIGAAGVDAVLVGETLMRATDTAAAVRSLASQPRTLRS